MPELTPTERRQRRDLVRMKATAAGLLAGAAALYVLAWRWESAGAPGWVGYLRAASEAGMVGGLADWFAVTALFRRPLGLPIPHTAIIPARKDALGRSLSDFVGANFLSEDVVRRRLGRAQVGLRVGRWLADRRHAERAAAEVAAVVRGAIDVLRDEDVQAVLEPAVARRLAAIRVGPPLGRLLGQVVADRAHHRLVDLLVAAADDWLRGNRETVVDAVARQAPAWSPEFIDRRIAARVYRELLRIAGEIRADGAHPLRLTLDRLLARLAEDLRHDPATIARADQALARLLDQPEVRSAFRDLVAGSRRLVLELIADPASELRTWLTGTLLDVGRRLQADGPLRSKVDGWLSDAAGHVVTHYRDELTTTITDTVERWDGAETSRKIELQVGRDLQFIRLNGTVVGALAGVAIHVVTVVLL